MNVFELDEALIGDYERFARSFTLIRAPDIRTHVDALYAGDRFWPEPLISINPRFERGASIGQLAGAGSLHEATVQVFSIDGKPLSLYRHQAQAIAKATAGQSFVVTTGTGSGKSLCFFIPIIDAAIRSRASRKPARTRAIVIYPMNALANSQREEIDKFIKQSGLPDHLRPTFARYTGQESPEERERIRQAKPDILLTNFMMLELLMTRQNELDRAVISNARGLEFLVLDELHTYRGRQGADIAMLVRRVRDRLCSDHQPICIGTSATMATEGDDAQRAKTIAAVSSRLFGTPISSDAVVGESLERATDSALKSTKLGSALAAAVGDELLAELDDEALHRHPLAVWCELEIGLLDGQRLSRRDPVTLADAAKRLADQTGCEEARCRSQLQAFLMLASRPAHERGGKGDRAFLAFKLHRFISGAGHVYATLRSSGQRRVTRAHADRGWWATKTACDLYVAAFLAPKHFRPGGLARAHALDRIPTTLDVRTAFAGRQTDSQLVAKAVALAGVARAFHWPLEFPTVMAAGGFDVVLGNPPWERIKLQEQEFFAAREPEIAEAPHAAARGRMIAKLKEAAPGTRERALYNEFVDAKRTAEASSVFARIPGEDYGRFPLTGRGDVNTYALFAELFSSLSCARGRAGVIVPTGIATDSSTSTFFSNLMTKGRLIRLYDFQTGMGFFDDIGHARFKFCLMTMGQRASREKGEAEFAFFLRQMQDFAQKERFFSLSAADIAVLNPNTKTAPIFRSRADAELTRKIYGSVPILINEAAGEAGNPWGIRFARMFDMSNDSRLFRTAAQLLAAGGIRRGMEWDVPANSANADRGRWAPVYEAKMVHHFDHRWATYDEGAAGDDDARYPTSAEKSDANFEIGARYWTHTNEVSARLSAIGWNRTWLCGWRDITNAGNERTVIGSVFPVAGVGNSLPIWLPSTSIDSRKLASFVANLASLPLDYVARLKVGGTHLNFFIAKQIAVLAPSAYSDTDLGFIVPRVLELVYTSYSMKPFARDLGYEGPPFSWDEDRRAQLRADLDAWYAHAYGLAADELRYVLDPSDVKGPDYPSETFRVLKQNEIARFGEYRTAKMILHAWEVMEKDKEGAAVLSAR